MDMGQLRTDTILRPSFGRKHATRILQRWATQLRARTFRHSWKSTAWLPSLSNKAWATCRHWDETRRWMRFHWVSDR